MLKFDDDKEKLKLSELRRGQEEDFVKLAASKRGLSYINLSGMSVDPDAMKVVNEADARAANAAVFSLLDKKVGLAITNPDDEKTKNLEDRLKTAGYIITLFMVSKPSLEHVFERYKELSVAMSAKAGAFEISNDEIIELISKLHSLEDVKNQVALNVKEKKNYRVTRIVEIILAGALAIGASDVHLEPEEGHVHLRYRLDGVLNDILDTDFTTYGYILSRIKVLSGLMLNVKNQAQDGRFSIKIKKTEIEVRTSIIPGAYGESIVLRVLDPESIAVPMEELGIEKHLLEIVQREIARPNGMILTTGPTGSGKTTTLYAFLKKVHTSDVKIITIEDPIEYHLPGIVQTQAVSNEKAEDRKTYTFLSGLRAALRQDPDIIMVGEIRDHETAEIAVNASLTGHLVFSTLHTNNAAGTFPRLLDLGVNAKTLPSAINIAMAQRLVRKLCPDCKKSAKLSAGDEKFVDDVLKTIPFDEYKKMPRKVFEPAGCKKCNNTGFKGRIGIYEAILSDPVIEKLILENPSEREIKDAARPQNIMDMTQDGTVKVLQGTTSLSELKRVIDSTEYS